MYFGEALNESNIFITNQKFSLFCEKVINDTELFNINESAGEKIKGILKSIVDKIIKVFERFIEFIKKIIDKIKEKFNKKPSIEKVKIVKTFNSKEEAEEYINKSKVKTEASEDSNQYIYFKSSHKFSYKVYCYTIERFLGFNQLYQDTFKLIRNYFSKDIISTNVDSKIIDKINGAKEILINIFIHHDRDVSEDGELDTEKMLKLYQDGTFYAMIEENKKWKTRDNSDRTLFSLDFRGEIDEIEYKIGSVQYYENMIKNSSELVKEISSINNRIYKINLEDQEFTEKVKEFNKFVNDCIGFINTLSQTITRGLSVIDKNDQQMIRLYNDFERYCLIPLPNDIEINN